MSKPEQVTLGGFAENLALLLDNEPRHRDVGPIRLAALVRTAVIPTGACDASGVCRAPLHVHGCFSDLDGLACDDPEDHQPRFRDDKES
jgi:hypothetical protein